jgi:hypothetical protein
MPYQMHGPHNYDGGVWYTIHPTQGLPPIHSAQPMPVTHDQVHMYQPPPLIPNRPLSGARSAIGVAPPPQPRYFLPQPPPYPPRHQLPPTPTRPQRHHPPSQLNPRAAPFIPRQRIPQTQGVGQMPFNSIQGLTQHSLAQVASAQLLISDWIMNSDDGYNPWNRHPYVERVPDEEFLDASRGAAPGVIAPSNLCGPFQDSQQ